MNRQSQSVDRAGDTPSVLDAKAETWVPDSGLHSDDVPHLAELLCVALADTYALYLKTQGLHWNVVRPLFFSLHELAEEQYTDLGAAVDRIAERIRGDVKTADLLTDRNGQHEQNAWMLSATLAH